MYIVKEELLAALEGVINNLNKQLNENVRDPFDYVKLDQKRRAFEEVKIFVNEEMKAVDIKDEKTNK